MSDPAHAAAPRVDGLGIAAAQLFPDRGATAGGDLYEAVGTECGVRVVMGDVRGHGMPPSARRGRPSSAASVRRCTTRRCTAPSCTTRPDSTVSCGGWSVPRTGTRASVPGPSAPRPAGSRTTRQPGRRGVRDRTAAGDTPGRRGARSHPRSPRGRTGSAARGSSRSPAPTRCLPSAFPATVRGAQPVSQGPPASDPWPSRRPYRARSSPGSCTTPEGSRPTTGRCSSFATTSTSTRQSGTGPPLVRGGAGGPVGLFRGISVNRPKTLRDSAHTVRIRVLRSHPV